MKYIIDETCNDIHRCKACTTDINNKITRKIQYIRTSDYINSFSTKIIKLINIGKHNIFPPIISVNKCSDRYTIIYNIVGLIKMNIIDNQKYINKWIMNNYIPFEMCDISFWHSQNNLYIIVKSDF